MKKRCLLFPLMIALVLSLGDLSRPANTEASGADQEFEKTVLLLGSGNYKKIKPAIKKLADQDAQKVLPLLEALYDRRLKVGKKGNIFILSHDKSAVQNALTGERISGKDFSGRTARINNSVRRVLSQIIARLKLQSKDDNIRLAAAKELAKHPTATAAGEIRRTLESETNQEIRKVLLLALAQVEIASGDFSRRIEAIRHIAESGEIRFYPILNNLLKKNPNGAYVETDRRIREAAEKAIGDIQTKQLLITQAGNFFYGLSLGSVLLLTALGLAITFGLMGVINMAHGEMLMLGAYSTYVIHNLFQTYLASLSDWYLAAAIPAAFLSTGLIGIILERSIIRYLYTRPLETLLATWGVSLIMIQTIRLIFGAQNVAVANPGWLSGGMEIMPGLIFTYNRIAIILFAVFVVTIVWFILQHTRMGLQIRAVTQNRPMATCMGVSAERVGMWVFGLGSGIAGLGGVALSQITNVGPELGQLYIVDSFLVVVLGGVGKIAGTVFASLGLGIVNKFLEPVSGAVLGKIFVLIFVILFIQRFPKGIFALNARVEEN